MPTSRLTVICLLLLALSCHKKNITGPAGPQGAAGANGADSILKGNLQGKVALYDTLGNPMTDNSGASVILENTSPLLQATTAIDGSFTIQSAHAGSYTLSIQKQGFGTMRYFNVVNTGTQPASQAGLLVLPRQMPASCDIKSLRIDSAVSGSFHYLVFTAILAQPHPVQNPRVVFYFNDSTGVGNNHNKFTFWSTFYQTNDSTLVYSPFDYQVSGESDRLAKTSNLYITIAIDNPKDFYYLDEQGNTVYPATAKPAPEVIFNNALHRY